MRPVKILALLIGMGMVAPAGAQVDLFVTDYMAPQTAEAKPLGDKPTTTVVLRATPGEYEPFTFLFRPRERFEGVMVGCGMPLFREERPGVPYDVLDAAAKATAGWVSPIVAIGPTEVMVASVEGYHGGEYDILVPVARLWDSPAWSTERFWVTVHVPDDAASGTYHGLIQITANGTPSPLSTQPTSFTADSTEPSIRRQIGAIAIELHVLPFRLEEPPYALGFNYSNPKDIQQLTMQLRDMHEHGMTTVGPLYEWHMPINDTATSELGVFLYSYKETGYTKPVYFAAPMSLMFSLAGYGPVDSQRFQRKYLKTMRTLFDEVQRWGVPTVFSIADELTNQGLPGVKYGEQLARLCFEELPEIPVTSDMNGYLEVVTMAPYLNAAAFNNGWDGADRHNKGRRLINREFIEEVRRLGAIPWFVNGGVGRFPFGFFFWKMARYGVQGKVEWYYRLGENERGSVVKTEGLAIYPTLAYERSREGIDDLKYVLRLEKAIADAKKAGRGAEESVRKSDALIDELGKAIVDNWTAYTDGGESWPAERYGQWRSRIIDQIVAIEKAAVSKP
jgi:hypothetical protein